MFKIGLLVIATNKYISYTYPLLESVRQYFMPGHEVKMFVFTNQPEVPPGAVRLEWPHLAWPGPTLKRYHAFLEHEKTISDMDYLYYCDADMRFVDTVGDEALGDMVATLHPGFYNKTKREFTYERRASSTAYMNPEEGFAYFAGGFNGGKTTNFLKMARTIRAGVDADTTRGIVALWHDESFLNKYLYKNPPTNVLNPSYCYPESANLPFKKKLLALDKNHSEMRS